MKVNKSKLIDILDDKVEELEKENGRCKKALKDINNICVEYTEKGWALNPDKIEKIINKAMT